MSATWDVDDNNIVKLFPVIGFHILPVAGISVAARIQFLGTPDQLEAEPEALQFVLTPAIALQLAEDLRKTAERILALPRPERLS